MSNFDNVNAALDSLRAAVGSAAAEIAKLAAEIASANGDQEALDNVAAQIALEAQALNDAVAAAEAPPSS